MKTDPTPTPPERPKPVAVFPLSFNVNWKVRVKLNAWGRDIFRERYDRMGIECGLPPEDADGWSEFQLWCLMEIYGPELGHGMEMPFETAIELLPEWEND